MQSIARVPEELANRFRPALEVILAPDELARAFAGVEFKPMERDSAPEPSIGAAVRLIGGSIATLAYGKGSHLLRVDLPEDESVVAFLREVKLPGKAITWLRGEGPPRSAAARPSVEPLPFTQAEVAAHRQAGAGADLYHRLTSRERDVLNLVVEGLSQREIAERLRISVLTVRTHVAKIMAKLDLGREADLVGYALRWGIVTRDREPIDGG